MLKKYKNKHFTLVELIVVIAIISILSLSAFLILTKWISNSKNSRRIGDLNIITTALNSHIISKGIIQYPIPDNSIEVYDISGALLWYQGKFGTEVSNQISELNKLPIDPDGGEYDYSISTNKRQYQIKAILDNGEQISFINKTSANNNGLVYIVGNFEGYILGFSGNIYNLWNIPSMFINNNQLSGYIVNSGSTNYLSINSNFEGSDYLIKNIDITNLFDENKNNDYEVINAVSSGFSISISNVVKILKNTGGVSINSSQIPIDNSIDGICGSDNGQDTVMPPTNLCSVGTASAVTDNGVGDTYEWTCEGENLGNTAYCSANHILSGPPQASGYF